MKHGLMKLGRAVDEFVRGYLPGSGAADKTVAAYWIDLQQFRDYAGDVRLERVDGGLVQGWVDALRESGSSEATLKRKSATLRKFCSYWVRKGALAESPFWRLDLGLGSVRSESRKVRAVQMRKLIVAAWRSHSEAETRVLAGGGKGAEGRQVDEVFRALRDLAIVEVLCATGMRIGEACALDAGDFIEGVGAFRVEGRGGRVRLAYVLSDEALRVVGEYLKARAGVGVETDALFINSMGGRLSSQGVINLLERLCAGAGLKVRVTPSTLRNSVEAVMLEGGVDLRVVFEQLGKQLGGREKAVAGGKVGPVSRAHLIRELRKVSPSVGVAAAA